MIGHVLTDKESSLLVELLENESRRLAVNARRTDAPDVRKEVRERQRTVDRLIQRLAEIKAGNFTS
ncbi:MAG TPA: hypothetical protein VGI81_28270 [Tepidisphaeraceae bacterium]|jgi:hypothetical protein